MIQISATARYATRIMVTLARNVSGSPIQARAIAREEAIPPDYALQILLKLKTAGLAASQRGVRGGFLLACDPTTTTVLDVIRAVDGDIGLAPCGRRKCPRISQCPTREVWDEAAQSLKQVLAAKTLADLAARHQAVSYEI